MKNTFRSAFLKITTLVTKLLRLLPPELSHNLALNGLKILNLSGFRLIKDKQTKTINLMGLTFENRLGIAGGLDKNGDYIEALDKLGCSFIELGTVTPRAQKGNKKPRLFRDTINLSLLNRMGFNNKGVDYLVSRVKKAQINCNVAISIGQNFDTPHHKVLDDYIFCLEKTYSVANLITLNISSPNTEGLRCLQSPKELPSFLSSLKEKQFSLSKKFGYKPLLVKISPDEDEENLKAIARTFISTGIDGLIATNTSINHQSKNGHGGISGKLLFRRSTKVLRIMREVLGKKYPIIASGGVTDIKTYKEKINSGADLVQIYTGLIYKGPQLISEILDNKKNN